MFDTYYAVAEEEYPEYFYEEFHTRDGAIEHGRHEFGLDTPFLLHTINKFIPTVDPDDIIRSLVDEAAQIDDEAAFEWESGIKPYDLHKLGFLLTKAFAQWMRETRNIPWVVEIVDTETIDGGDK